MSLPKDAKARKTYPIATGFLDYFPDAIAEVAHVSFIGNEQHNPGMPLFWDRTKSQDEADAMMRHFLKRGTLDDDGVPHSAKVVWRACAMYQKEIEAKRLLCGANAQSVKSAGQKSSGTSKRTNLSVPHTREISRRRGSRRLKRK